MPRFEINDTVALKADRSLVGTVDRLSYLDAEPLEDCLIIAHVDVPSHILQEFVVSGIPPKGYVFVIFADQEQGSSLVGEHDIILLDRILEVGDVVKQEGTQAIGTVINVSSAYVLAPLWRPMLTGSFLARPADQNPSIAHRCSTACSPFISEYAHPRYHELILNVPFEELKRVQDFFEGDYMLENDWMGIVDSCDISVIVLLENGSIVAVQEPEELLIPVPEFDKPIVSLPEFDGMPRPDFLSATQGYSSVIPPEDLQCGQMVVTNQRNLRNGRWLKGDFDISVKPQGRVIMVRARRVNIRWLACNAFTPETYENAKKPELRLPYENLSTFPDPQEIRRDKRLALYDPSKPCNGVENRMRTTSGRASNGPPTTKGCSTVNLSSTFTPGDRVKFRDAAGAAVKYQGSEINGIPHGRFDRILPIHTYGYDLNEFKIVQSLQRAVIRWQDGTISQLCSTTLTKFNLFESDLMPADVIVSREGMKQREEPEDFQHRSPRPLVDFNEMTFFEKRHDLFPQKVGIIQHVNPTERVAQVRWFSNPKIRITSYGNALGGDSRFGPIAQDVEDVSLYEVMAFAGLTRRLRDIVLIPPRAPSCRAIDLIRRLTPHELSDTFGVTALSQQEGHHASEILEWLQYVAKATTKGDEPREITDEAAYKAHKNLDWLGEIVQLGTDGTVCVRTDAGSHCKDIILEHDQLLCFVDDQYYHVPDMNDDPMDLDVWDSLSEGSSGWGPGLRALASESVEYEGGRRLDNDSGDDNWESEDDLQAKSRKNRAQSVMMEKTDTLINGGGADPSTATSVDLPNSTEHPLKLLRSYMPDTEPNLFAILERDPPADQFKKTHPPATSPTFLKRIMKEHRILTTALPKQEIYVRTYENRLDLLRCLIIGPADTPYEYAPFLVDLHLGHNFPHEPPTAHFHSWTSGLGRINPNLYEEGKICLSLLGTWPGKSEAEGWSEKATILQLLVSLQGLVFVKAPFFNEAGFEEAEAGGEYGRESLQYAEKAFVITRGFVKHALTRPVGSLEDVLAWLYLPNGTINALKLLEKVHSRGNSLIARSEDERNKEYGEQNPPLLDGSGAMDDPTKVFLKPLSKGAIVMLQKTIRGLEEMLK